MESSERKRVSIIDASKILGMSQQCVRIRMSRNLFNPPIGRVIPSMSGKSERYFIYEDMLERYVKGV
ncbi:MAG: hypothetical protein SOW32_07835 [Agathobacter sp.]|nr:hypothetical protein [Agathobacter sp.]